MITGGVEGEKKEQREGCALESCLSEAKVPNVEATVLITISYSNLIEI